ncbi:lipoprotein insertase outer membrane protein LolB [Alteromonas oceanisediminis]|uniref:lipoprotein insertase outer membrane protein LolB n=1 Tax=Alteromonas oceanisediminis TaxID=2836180 RepID=UPI001BDB02F4|nr:lipoprotein insertase outer membrane protein LolB [Alteromonas oceanisediminis]MBT0587325.1 lipoprotein insertase outer membrane protein LolB [Alteromonas oceanisediminis]
MKTLNNLPRINTRFLFITRLLYVAIAAVLAGCTTAYQPVKTVNQSVNDAKLIKLVKWELRGRMAIKTDQESVSAYVRWHQQKDQFEFTLTNVLGVTLLTLTFDGQLAELTIDDKNYRDTDPQRLLEDVSGWQIPVDLLPIWVKGLARPQDKTTRTSEGLLTQILPSGSASKWRVDFSGYSREVIGNNNDKQPVSVVLPRQLTIQQNAGATARTFSLKLKVNHWEATAIDE